MLSAAGELGLKEKGSTGRSGSHASARADAIGQPDHAGAVQADQQPAQRRHQEGDQSQEKIRFAVHSLPHSVMLIHPLNASLFRFCITRFIIYTSELVKLFTFERMDFLVFGCYPVRMRSASRTPRALAGRNRNQPRRVTRAARMPESRIDLLFILDLILLVSICRWERCCLSTGYRDDIDK